MPHKPPIPQKFQPLPHGIFDLRGGPLCGMGTDESPLDNCVIGLVYVRPGNRNRKASTHMTEYRWSVDDCIYEFVGMERVAWG